MKRNHLGLLAVTVASFTLLTGCGIATAYEESAIRVEAENEAEQTSAENDAQTEPEKAPGELKAERKQQIQQDVLDGVTRHPEHFKFRTIDGKVANCYLFETSGYSSPVVCDLVNTMDPKKPATQ